MGVGAEGAQSLRAMSGKIAHLSNQQTSDFRKQFRGKQPVSVRPGVAHAILVLVVVVGGGGVPFKATHPRYSLLPRFVPFVVFVHVNCFCPLKIQQRNQKKKKNENKRNES